MMLRSAFLAVLLAGCSAPETPAVAPDGVAAADETAKRVPGPRDQLLLDRWIVYRGAPEPRACTGTHKQWVVTPLFTGATAARLTRYCVYTRGEQDKSKRKPPRSAGTKMAPDRLAVASLGLPDPKDIESNTVALVDPIGAFATLPTPKAWLAILDTIPTLPVGSPPPGASPNDPHGVEVASLARRAICDGPGGGATCAGILTSQLALAWTRDSSGNFGQPTAGGSIGTQADVATAVYDEVSRWETASAAGKAGSLVLNLSLGWHPAAGGPGPASSWSPPVAAVAEALRYASCQDALVLAAAGHLDTRDGVASRTGPVYPAAWERLAAPSRADCAADYGSAPGVSKSTYRRLVYGVGGVDLYDEPLAITRPGSMPLRAAAGSHLASFNPAYGGLVRPVTGTSAATAVVSSAATVVRTVHPTMTAHDVMAKVVAGGRAAPFDADVCATTGPCGATSIVTVCGALAEACDGQPCATDYPASDCSTTAPTALATTFPVGTPTTVLGDADSAGCGIGDTYYWDSSRYSDNAVNCPIQDEVSAVALAIVQPMPPKELCPWCPAQPGTAGAASVVGLFTTEDLVDYENLAITVHFDYNGGIAGDPDHYPVPSLTGTTNEIELPTSAFDDRVIGPDTFPVTGVTFDYMPVGQPFAYSEPLYLE